MTIKKTLVTVLTSGSLILGSMAPMAYADVAVVGNGAGSDNHANVSSNSDTTVVQNNRANVDNNVSTYASTGGNSANNLTGGNAAIMTGDAVAVTGITNLLNSNSAHVDNCTTCGGQGGMVVIDGNGAYSYNRVNADNSANIALFQNNSADVNNNVHNDLFTGHNNADNATGGNVSIRTGNAKAITDVVTKANSNVADIMGGGNGGFMTAGIAGNGAFSSNDISLMNNHDVQAVQDNNAWVNNRVDGDFNTGLNHANNGTNGDIAIMTGDAVADTGIYNKLNANIARIVDCGCGLGGDLVKIYGNGAFSASEVNANNNHSLSDFGTNDAYVNNFARPDLMTGHNALDNATGGYFRFSDPSVRTGNAVSQTVVDNEANLNDFGSFNMGGVNFGLGFDPMGLFR